ncbi:hypothetical protein [Candidatus Synchoanobacter obligatus]|uniref:Type IV / VI secretion system DotU domain-containing protein n=1 Tax=Candidatus Synchoanobacter obligatus TaxID=2919597 RepID=A0ABT1L442_9GAMM|nr:hypothetical protein [Candidatus Synchoanobacter obligatus]MCP8351938.1 hypothetical protein [Candidatus Synchoanobacter obligatus]
MDPTQLFLSLEDTPEIESLQYYITSELILEPKPEKLLELTKLLDAHLKHDSSLNDKQAQCMQYLYRDWGYNHVKEDCNTEDKKALFTINESEHPSGLFLDAINFAKRNPKNNRKLISFSLMLLTHSANSSHQNTLKIEAIEQFLHHIEPPSYEPIYPVTNNLPMKLLLTANILASIYCLWSISILNHPFI